MLDEKKSRHDSEDGKSAWRPGDESFLHFLL
jgi:hypothetical protein